jgi:cobalt transporter subunit CbtA
MLKKMLTSALFAGIAAGAVASVLHLTMLVPMIIEAEQYETGALTHFTAAPDNTTTIATPTEAGDTSLWHRDTNALHRNTMTFGAEMVAYTGFALLMVALFAVAEKYGQQINARRGMLWGLAGLLAFQIAPAAGLPAETPGIPAADLAARQIWWASTVLATGTGIALIAFGRNWLLPLVGIGLILLPQIIGAPHLTELSGVVPPSVASLFAGRSIAVAAASWTTLGLLCGYFWNKQAAS